MQDTVEQMESRVDLRNLYRALNMSSIVAFTDARGTIIYVNDKFCEISKYSKEELLGQNHRIINSGYHPHEFFIELWKTISSGKVWTGEIKNRAKDGTFYWVLTTIVPFLNEYGKPYQYISIRTEITKLKKIQEEQNKIQLEIERATIAQHAAEDLLERKNKFLDIAAHELRTPISTLSLLLQIAVRQTEKGKPLTYDILAQLRAPTDRLTRLTIDLLEMAKLERRLIILSPVLTDLVLLIVKCVEEFRVLAPNRHFIFDPPNLPLEIKIDPLRINQVLSNLLDNAVKYTKEGPIEIILEVRSNVIRVSVKDHGAGIPKEQQTKLFTTFTRGNSDATIRAGGLGLGLSICREIIDLHGGTIGFVSEENNGSSFYFELPLPHE